MLGFAGVLVVVQPASSNLPGTGLIFAVLGAIGSGTSHVLFRYAGRTASAITSTIWSTVVITALSSLLLPRFAEWHDPKQLLLLVALGVSGGFAQLLMTASVRVAPVAAVVPFDYVQLIWAVLLGWMLWAASPAISTWVGGGIIIASGLATIYREHRHGRLPPRSLLQP
jgi:drug/metabolite transporter (DMT)-like permease